MHEMKEIKRIAREQQLKEKHENVIYFLNENSKKKESTHS